MREPAWRRAAPWLALIAWLVVPPSIWPQSWLLAWLSQTAAMIVFALSYNLLLGETGLLSFGHAAYAGLGALIAAQIFNRFAVPLVLLPLIGGLGAALCGVVFGFVSTRRAGTAFAMITLGIGELISAAAWTLPDWFGGEAGVAIDRTHAAALAGWTFGPAREAYGLIASWCLLASVAMFGLSRTAFMRLANAVRDNPARAAAIGCYPRRVRHGVVVLAAFFAGIAGTLGLIDVELVSTESVGMMRSGAVLIATVIGGTASFFGPVAGAIVLTFFSVVVGSMTRAWLFYLGLLFIVIVMASPDGLAGFARRHGARIDAWGWRGCRGFYLWASAAVLLLGAAVVVAVQWAYAVQFGADDGTVVAGLFTLPALPALPTLPASAQSIASGSGAWTLGLTLTALAASGAFAAHAALRARARLHASTGLRAHASQSTDGDAP
ncbi:branched-chain amino acid ABC transporter permease [Paraburkholderia sp. BCC1886]|uniref:branched-chain amino acid ABC transporter permease n=1 Tax=Paraburkholderia sp. BCC1886 TaxID=2562670 RepID=UPI001183507D|nr:branched-chain amino acid ABC transporter permease [Paraburkholderia sp. BCC1886]